MSETELSAALDSLSVSCANCERESSDERRAWVRRRASVTFEEAFSSRSSFVMGEALRSWKSVVYVLVGSPSAGVGAVMEERRRARSVRWASSRAALAASWA